ncbi:MAG: SDR family NAD(P)-dependent oxidoreductase, partial [Alphaproteobacteria bacterium]
VSEAFAPHVKASEDKKILAVSSLAGSFGYQGPNIAGGYWYKSSKTALNMYMKNIASDLKADGVIVAVLSPGTVKVEKMGDANFPGLIEPEDSIGGMISVIDGLTIEESGAYYRYDGTPQPF